MDDLTDIARPDAKPELESVPMPIETERLLLRPFVREDAEDLGVAVRGSYEHLRRWMPWASEGQTTDESLVVIAGMIAKWADRTDLPVGIYDRTSGELLGGSGLHRIDWQARCFEIGYWIRPEHEGNGYITETAAALTAFAIDTLGAMRVEIRLDAANARSQAVPVRLGFVHEGTLRRNALSTDGDFRDTEVYALLRTDDLSRIR